MMYAYDLLPIYNYFKAVDGEIKLLSKDDSEVEPTEAELILSNIGDKFAEIVADTSYKKSLVNRSQLVRMNAQYNSCLFALERLRSKPSDAMFDVLTRNGFNPDKDNLQSSLQDIYEQLQSLHSLYTVRISEYVKENEFVDKADMYSLVSDVENGLTRLNNTDTKINVQTTPILQLAHYIKRIKDDGKRIKNTDR